MHNYYGNIEALSLQNENFRQVLYTTKNFQLVLMCLQPGEEIGEEIHASNDQFFRIESGAGQAVMNGHEYLLTDGVVVIVPAGQKHNIINTSNSEDLKLYTLYAPPHHRDQVIHETKADALTDDEEFNGQTS